MQQKDIVRILSGGAKIVKKASDNVKTQTSNYLKNEILKNEFVTREEYKQLQKLVFKLLNEIELLKNNKK